MGMARIARHFHGMVSDLSFRGHSLASHMRRSIALADIGQKQYEQEDNLAFRHLHRCLFRCLCRETFNDSGTNRSPVHLILQFGLIAHWLNFDAVR